MRYVVAVGIRRLGKEDDPKAEVIVAVQYSDGSYEDIGRERVGANFSSWWKIKGSE